MIFKILGVMSKIKYATITILMMINKTAQVKSMHLILDLNPAFFVIKSKNREHPLAYASNNKASLLKFT
jgi:hypothetical protein